MQRIIQCYTDLWEKQYKYGDDVSNRGLISVEKNPFNMIFNEITLTLEILSFYDEAWKRPTTGYSRERIELAKKQNAERINGVTKRTFIEALSIIEYSAKEVIKSSDNQAFSETKEKFDKREWVYLMSIIKASLQHGIIDEATKEKWEGIIKLRNCLVHNNAIADYTKTYQIQELEITFADGKPVKHNLTQDYLTFFPRLVEIITDLYYQWLQKI